MQVLVRDNNVDQALRALKQILQMQWQCNDLAQACLLYRLGEFGGMRCRQGNDRCTCSLHEVKNMLSAREQRPRRPVPLYRYASTASRRRSGGVAA